MRPRLEDGRPGAGKRPARWVVVLAAAWLAASSASAGAAGWGPGPFPRRSGAPRIIAWASANTVAVHDEVEVVLHVRPPVSGNPFTDVEVDGTLTEKGRPRMTVLGFCDSEDGSVFRIRFLPRRPGIHRYTVRYSVPGDGVEWMQSGWFRAVPAGRKGIVQVDPERPERFIWEGTGEHFFYTGATAYHLLSWTDEDRMLAHFNRMADAGANRIRFLNYGRASDDEWSEGMEQDGQFVWTVSPWRSQDPAAQLDEGSIGPDHTRFDLAHWRKAERLIRAMRERDVVAAVNLYMDRGISPQYGPDDAPSAGSAEEDLYFRYAVARYGAFGNVMWDLGTEHDEYRTAEWAASVGSRIREWDPFDHLISAHPNRFRTAYMAQAWYGFAEHQYYGVEADAFGGDVLERVNRHIRFWGEQARAGGRPVPQVNEEYGYELDPSGYDEPAAQIRKKAWAIVMGGGYLTSGEHKAWQHGDPTNGGRVEADTRILGWTALLRRFFEDRGIPFRDLAPMEALDGSGFFGLHQPGHHYVVYLPDGGAVSLVLPEGLYAAHWFRPSSGETIPLDDATGGAWQSPPSPAPLPGEEEDGDWVLYLGRRSTP